MTVEELTKEQIKEISENLINIFGKLNMIYIRVSTNNKGQQEEDQLPEILKTFNLDKDECLIVRAKESAFNEKKDKYRLFNVFFEIIERYKDYDKTLYVWDLDRIYRNQKKQAHFISYFADKNNCKVLSYRQKFFHQFKEMDGVGRAMYNFMIEVFGWMAEEESKKKGDRLLKSLTKREDGRLYTNKGTLYGNKLTKKIINKGKPNEYKIYFNAEEQKKINKIIKSLHKKGLTYDRIILKFKEIKNISISKGYISKVMNND